MPRQKNATLRRAIANTIRALERGLLRQSLDLETLKTKHRAVEARYVEHGEAIERSLEDHRRQLAELEAQE